MNVKDCFWGSLSVMMLGIFSTCVYYIWQNEHIRQKRSNLYEYYVSEFNSTYFSCFRAYFEGSPQDNNDYLTIEKTKADMLQDGFDRIEISIASIIGFDRAQRDMRDVKEKREEAAKKGSGTTHQTGNKQIN